MRTTQQELRHIIQEILEAAQPQYSFLPDGVTVEDFAKVIKGRGRPWTAAWRDDPPIPRENYVSLLQTLENESDRQAVQFILDVWDMTQSMPPVPDLENIAIDAYQSLGVDRNKVKDSGLFRRSTDFYNELYKSGGYFKKLDFYIRAPFDTFNKYPISQVLSGLRRHLSNLPMDLYDDLLAVYDLHPMFLKPINLPDDMEYLKDNLGDMAMSGVDGLRQAADIIKTFTETSNGEEI